MKPRVDLKVIRSILLGIFLLGIIILFMIDSGFKINFLFYLLIITLLVLKSYKFILKGTKWLTNKPKKIIVTALLVIIITFIFGSLLALGDYLFLKNGMKPYFSLREIGIINQTVNVEESGNQNTYYEHREYFGLGYKYVVCDYCFNKINFFPLGFGSYAWFIDEQVSMDDMSGNWYHANDNYTYVTFDGLGNYSLIEQKETTEEGRYTLENKVLILTGNKKNKTICNLNDRLNEFKCERFDFIFMK